MIRFAPILLVVLAACGLGLNDPSGGTENTGTTPKYASATLQLQEEFGGKAEPAAFDRVADLAKRLTLETRSLGIIALAKGLKDAAPATASTVDGIEDFTLGEPLPGVGEYTGTKTDDALGDDNPNKKAFDCPNIDATGYKSCVELVDAVLNKVKGEVDVTALQNLAKQMFEEDALLKAQPQEFKDFALNYLNDLALNIHKFGIHSAAVRAEYALRKAGLCDKQPISGKEIARLRGIEEGETIIRDLVAKMKLKLAPKGNECVKLGPKGPAADAVIKAAVEEFIKVTKPVCEDTTKTNPVVMELESLRKDGIQRSIDAHLTTIMVGIFRNGKKWNVTEYVALELDGCEAKDQIQYTTSPLVIDLDNDGLDLTTDRVTFDLRATGQMQQTAWAGAREGFLALDLDGDGRITSGRELFGDNSLCGIERCADGAAALAVHDTAAKGGNGDGKIDAQDAVFKSLRVWVDRNHDGRSQQSELTTLADRGIKALSLRVKPLDLRVPGGRISLSLEVVTDHGTRTAYDVWFENLTQPGFKTPAY